MRDDGARRPNTQNVCNTRSSPPPTPHSTAKHPHLTTIPSTYVYHTSSMVRSLRQTQDDTKSVNDVAATQRNAVKLFCTLDSIYSSRESVYQINVFVEIGFLEHTHTHPHTRTQNHSFSSGAFVRACAASVRGSMARCDATAFVNGRRRTPQKDISIYYPNTCARILCAKFNASGSGSEMLRSVAFICGTIEAVSV